jgi:hypothetical protein
VILVSNGEFELFLEQVSSRPMPTNPMSRIETFAKELAEGASQGHWGVEISTFRGAISEGEENVVRYLQKRWELRFPHLGLLITNRFLEAGTNSIVITKPAFDLLNTVEPSTIFISYRRADSSAFALLVLARLKAAGLNAFLDLAIQPGDNWRTHLKSEIQNSGHFVALLGKGTLTSEVVHQEILWAIEGRVNIIPIWHNGFFYKSGEFNLPPQIDAALQNTHTIRVLEESALAYNNAIVELLNFFGITP